ncbi:PP2C family protein-serine/threonine phosphatase [Daejeonella sp.]|uniref:PP2C family protein-serine/threonine phosphatase n=1 Tax=Daejeonella sp. TaxID=2805397 RepID=UPI002725178D|nr:PP2C family protein-serine/threonine phosphatase [Daejeonella sp.]MDO8994444.1 PP2C family protein-serine/threonine phosphatase [Daejeonella sp.]MDP2414239.1 PP2C family protein-serine/threonine phosphatase [Daejeonella sp.]
MQRKPISAVNDESELIQLLLKRQAELNSLLEITQAININSPSSVLFEMLEVILNVHLKIGKIRLLIKEGEHFYCATRFGGEFENAKTLQQTCQTLIDFRNITSLKSHDDPLLNKYEYFVPVFHNQELLAFVLVGDFDTSQNLLRSDLNFIQTLINVIVVALENKKLLKERVGRERLQRDMELAVEVQGMLIPRRLPKTGAVEVGATYLPNENIGGDYFDFIKLGTHEYLWCIADASGKGVSAALLMANLQASLRAWASVERNLVKLTERLNEIVYSNTNGERFVTLFLGLYNEQTRELQYVNAGHNPSVLIMDGKVKFLKEGTTIIGAFDILPVINLGREILTSGSIVFNYTDGLVESPNEEVYISDQELVSHLLESCNLEVDILNENILRSIQSLNNAKMDSDDITLLTIRVS